MTMTKQFFMLYVEPPPEGQDNCPETKAALEVLAQIELVPTVVPIPSIDGFNQYRDGDDEWLRVFPSLEVRHNGRFYHGLDGIAQAAANQLVQQDTAKINQLAAHGVPFVSILSVIMQ